MKKISKTSLIIGIVLIVLAVVLNVLGFLDINGMRCVRCCGNPFFSMTYTTSSSVQMICMAMIITGGFLFIGGILLLMLSAITCPCRCRHHDHKPEEVQKAEGKAPCCCAAKEHEQEPAEPAEEEQATE